MVSGHVLPIRRDHVPIALKRRRQQLHETPRTTSQKISGCSVFGHICHMRLPVGTVAQRYKMAVQGDALNAQTMRTLQNRRIGGIEVGFSDRLIRFAMLTAIGRAGSQMRLRTVRPRSSIGVNSPGRFFLVFFSSLATVVPFLSR